MDEFITPPQHILFKAKKLFGGIGEVVDGSIAYLEEGGGGPLEKHTHAHDHLFFVIQGQAEVLLGEETHTIRQNEAFLVDGSIPHSVWNRGTGETVMLGISVKK